MIDFNDKCVLITTNDWFYAPNGQQYKAVWGKVKICKSENLLGVKPHNYANWFVIVDDVVLIAGCQIHYVLLCDQKPIGNSVFIKGDLSL